MALQRIYLISLDFLENFEFEDSKLDFTDVIKFLLCNNEEDLVVSYSRDNNRIERVKKNFPIEDERLLFIGRKPVTDLIKKYNDYFDVSFIVIGKKNKDFEMAVNNKLLFITPTWLSNIENKADKYGIKVDSAYQLLEFIKTIINQKNWYSKLVLPDDTIVLSLSDGRSRGTYPKSIQEKEVVEQFNRILKKGNRNYYEMYFYHFLSSISNNKELFNDINYWGFFPSSSGHVQNNEMFLFKEKVRKMMKGQPLRNEHYKNNPNLLIRHTPTYKSHDIKDLQKRINTGSTNHFNTIKLNKAFKDKLKDRNVCIFDDYLTHGNSSECARNLLRKAGVNKLVFVTLGRFAYPYQYQEYSISGNIYEAGYKYSLTKIYEIPRSKFEVNEEAKDEVENLHRIFNL